MSENETLEEMAMRVIQGMKDELKEAGYERFSELFNKGLTLHHPYEPDMMLWDEGLFFHSLDQAYEHLQKERKFQAMETLITKLAKARPEAVYLGTDDWRKQYPVLIDLADFIEEAKRILGDGQEAG